MRMYDTLIACLVKYKNFKEIKKDEFLHSLYQIWDMVFWDDEDDISPMKAKYLASRISKFLKIDLYKDIYKNESWVSTAESLQKHFFRYFYDNFRRKYLKTNVLYVVSNRLEEVNGHHHNIIYEIPTLFVNNSDKQNFVDCVNELIYLNHCTIVQRDTNNLFINDVKKIFKKINPTFLHIDCQHSESVNEPGNVFLLKLSENDACTETGSHTNHIKKKYFEVRFTPASSNKDIVPDIEANNGILSIFAINISICCKE